MTVTRTHTKTYVLLNAWASTVPWTCDTPGHTHSPMVGDPCAVPRCREQLQAHETVYAVTETGGPDAPEPIPCTSDPSLTTAECHHTEQWVCWRHIRPDDGPIVSRP